MSGHPNYSGLVIAGVGFVLTRFTVTMAISQDAMRFYVGGVVPLALGLGLAAFGVALTVSDVDPRVVRTTAIWCVVGATAMLLLVVLTLLGSTPDGMLDLESVRSQTYLSNFLIGGSIGGTLTGLYAGRNRRQRRVLRQQRNRLEVLNRMLRHEVLNALTAIRGHAALGKDSNGRTERVVEERSADIEATIEEVSSLTRRTDRPTRSGAVRLAAVLEESVATVTDRHPEASVSLESVPDDLAVRADGRLARVFTHLLENAVVHGADDSPAVEVTTDRSGVQVTVADAGPGLPANQQRLLESGDIEEFDDPSTGFGLNVVRLLVETYGGTVETAVHGEVDRDGNRESDQGGDQGGDQADNQGDNQGRNGTADPAAGSALDAEAARDATESGTRITITVPRAEDDPLGLTSRRGIAGVGTTLPHLAITLVAAVLAGVTYGLASEVLGQSIAGIGVFYGTAAPTVGWITHEFHSVVFGFAYVGLLGLVPIGYREGILSRLGTFFGVGVAWALVLWIGAAGVLAPVWLQLSGIAAPIPSLQGDLLVPHLVWGLTLAGTTALGFEIVASRWGRSG